MYEELVKAIKEYDTIIIHRHKNPDGDAIGSQVGLKHLITKCFPDKKVYMVGDEAGRYSFMDDSVMDVIDDDTYKNALAIVVDCGGDNMICDERWKTAAKTARVDHHVFTEKIADIEIIDSTYESACGMITEMSRESGLKPDAIGIKSLFTGMVTDSGRFRYDCTTEETFERAAYLMRLNKIDFNDLYSKMYAEDFDAMKRRAEFVMKIRFTKNNVAYMYNTLEDVEKTGLSTFSVSRGMVGVMGDIKNVDIWVNFTESEEGVLCELRSSKYNINPVAVKYGGGGHEKASGATVKDKETAMLMLEDLNEMSKKEV